MWNNILVGLFLRPFSEVLGNTGILYATEVSEVFIQHLEDVAQKEDLKNIVIELSPALLDCYSSIPDGSIDTALICDVYHHFEYPKTTMRGKSSYLDRNFCD